MCLQIFLVLVLLTLLVGYMIYERCQCLNVLRRLNIPGPKPNFFVGNMLELSGNGKLIIDVMDKWESQFGLVYGYFRGTKATLVIRDLELVKDVLVKNSADFINRPLMVVSIPPLPHTVVGLRGQRWKEVRQTLSPVFSSAKIKQMFPIMSNCVQTTIEILKEKSDAFPEKQVIDSHKLFQGLACDVICACALAMKVNSQRDDNDKFFKAVQGFLENAVGPFVQVSLCFPLMAKVMGWALKAFGVSHEMTQMIINNVKASMEHRRRIQLTENVPKPADALQFMMDATVPEMNHLGRVEALSDEEIIANAWVFILGGFETTSSALCYTCNLLGIHQDVQETLFNELKDVIEFDEVPTYDKISGLTYLDQVICESLRLYPPVINFVVRGTDKTVQIGKYKIPKGVGIQIPVWQVHHDPSIWPEPYDFDPSRFNNNAKRNYANNMQWLPFGTGPRSCIGARFAVLNMKFTLCSILRKFRVISTAGNHQRLKLRVPSVTIVPADKVPLRFIPRLI